MIELRLSGTGTLQNQVFEAVRDAVVRGHLRSGQRLPSSRALAASLGVSRITTLAAFERLESEGLVEAKHGSGTFVAPIQAVEQRAPSKKTAVRRFSRYTQLLERKLATRKPVPGGRSDYAFDFGQSRSLVDERTDQAWRRAVGAAAKSADHRYPHPAGNPALRELICGHLMRRLGVECSREEVLITSGTQQSLSLLTRVLLDPGEVVMMESPGYDAARLVFQLAQLKIRHVAVDEEGANFGRLTGGEPSPGLIYVTPAHQFPLGHVMSLARRSALLEYARRHRSWVVEDDYDGHYRYSGQPVASLRLLDNRQRVIHLGTFSKVLDPGLRLAYIVASPDLIRALARAKAVADQGSPSLIQSAMARFIETGAFDRHLARSRKRLAKRRNRLVAGIKRHLQIDATGYGTETGSFLTIELPLAARESAALLRSLSAKSVFLQSADVCYPQRLRNGVFVFGYGGIAAERVETGIELVAEALREISA